MDVACFVHNGKYYSAPAFVTFYALPHEIRTYDKSGRLVKTEKDEKAVIDPRL